MIALSRNDNSSLGRWWWTVDKMMLSLVLLLITAGLLINLTASPAVSVDTYGSPLRIFWKQVIFTVPAVVGLFITSMLSDTLIRRLNAVLMPGLLIVLVLTLMIGTEAKGATRWLTVGPFSLQPSEFVKPVFIVFNAWILSAAFDQPDLPAKQVSLAALVTVVGLLVLQPDFGQSLLVFAVWAAQLSLAGLPLLWLGLLGVAGLVGIALAYILVPYVASRIDRFLHPESGDTYQADLAIDAIESGGVMGRGLSEGTIKDHLPDAHSDYVFAVIGEELGAIIAVPLLMVFLVIVMRGLNHLLREDDPFRLLAAGGLLLQFGLQTIINVGVNVGMLPSKGMTLPFISAGGSSTLALAFGMGMVLALTRRNPCLQGPATGPAVLGLR